MCKSIFKVHQDNCDKACYSYEFLFVMYGGDNLSNWMPIIVGLLTLNSMSL